MSSGKIMCLVVMSYVGDLFLDAIGDTAKIPSAKTALPKNRS